MSEIDQRLAALFRATFPDLDEKDLRQVTRDSIASWDSIAAVTLVTLIEDEFGEEFDLDSAAQWTSYIQIREELGKRLRA